MNRVILTRKDRRCPAISRQLFLPQAHPNNHPRLNSTGNSLAMLAARLFVAFAFRFQVFAPRQNGEWHCQGLDDAAN